VNRIQRDFQEAREDNLGFTSTSIKTNLAQIVKDDAEKQGIYCQCIRCCEVSTEKYAKEDIQYFLRSFTASGACEYFISAEIPRPNRNLLLGFLRLRLGSALETSIIPELQGKTAMIRELHVYGRVKHVGHKDAAKGGSAQHFGIGKELLSIGEYITSRAGFEKMAIISGIGVRDYYRKRGYELCGSYMMKKIEKYRNTTPLIISVFVLLLAIIMYMFKV
jgi:elongator complex protein 3